MATPFSRGSHWGPVSGGESLLLTTASGLTLILQRWEPPPPRPPQVTDTDVSRLLLGRNSQGSTGGRRSEQIDPASLGRRAESPLTLSTARPPGLCALPVRGDMSIDGDCKHGTGPPLSSDAELISGPCSAQRKWCRNKFPHECRPGM